MKPVQSLVVEGVVVVLIGKSLIASEVLELISYGGCVSKGVLKCMGFSVRNSNMWIKRLVDNGWLREYGNGHLKRYRLQGKGAAYLDNKCEFNDERDGDNEFEDQVRFSERAMTVGDSAVLFMLAGYRVRADDKPALPVNLNCAFNDEQCSYYFKSTELKHYAQSRFGTGTNAVQYSRTTGVLLTPDHLYRIYHTRNVAMDFRITGERGVQSLLSEMFEGYPTKRQSRVILLGYSFRAADSILTGSLYRQRITKARRVGGITSRLNASNLSTHLLFFPVRQQCIILLRFLRYKGSIDWLESYITEVLFPDCATYETGFYLGEIDGFNLLCGIYMNLTHLSVILGNMRTHRDQKVSVLCLDWQRDFYEKHFSDNLGEGNQYELFVISTSDFEEIVKTYENSKWGDDS